MCTKFNVQKSILCAKQNLHPPNLSIIIMVLTYRYCSSKMKKGLQQVLRELRI